MRFGGTQLSVLQSFPTLDKPSQYATLSHTLGIYVSSSDTVCIKQHVQTPPIIGCILNVKCSLESVLETDECVHPYVMHGRQENHSLLRINWYIVKDSSVDNAQQWPHTTESTLRACAGLQETAQTNCVVWVSIYQVESIVFIPHSDTCTNHTFGPMFGRHDTYYIQNQVFFEKDSDNFTFFPLSSSDYCFFGHKSPNNSP